MKGFNVDMCSGSGVTLGVFYWFKMPLINILIGWMVKISCTVVCYIVGHINRYTVIFLLCYWSLNEDLAAWVRQIKWAFPIEDKRKNKKALFWLWITTSDEDAHLMSSSLTSLSFQITTIDWLNPQFSQRHFPLATPSSQTASCPLCAERPAVINSFFQTHNLVLLLAISTTSYRRWPDPSSLPLTLPFGFKWTRYV